MNKDNEPIYLLDPKSLDVKLTFDNKQQLRRLTGMSASSIYRRIGVPPADQKPVKLTKGAIQGEYLISQKSTGLKLEAADPNAEYMVTDGTRVYHKGGLEECKQMKTQIGFPTLQVKLWQKPSTQGQGA